MARVTLSQWERKVARATAKKRFRTNREQNVENGKIGNQSNETTDILGIAGEIAFCKYFNLYPDLQIQPRKGGVDALLDGKTVDVKTTDHFNGQLLAKKSKKEKDHAQIFFLVTGELPHFTLRGYAKADRLMQESNLTDLGYGPTFALPQKELKNVPDGSRVRRLRGEDCTGKPENEVEAELQD